MTSARRSDSLARSSDPQLAAHEPLYDPAERHILFELKLTEARCNGRGDTPLPAGSSGQPPADQPSCRMETR